MHSTKQFVASVLREALGLCLALFRILVPVVIVVRLMELAGLVDLVAAWLFPVMQSLGLPGEAGLIWATAMVTNVYGGIAVLAPNLDLTVADVTALCGMVLIALIVTLLLFVLRLLDRLGVTDWLQRMLQPLLSGLGIGRQAATLTVVGITLGISRGGALLMAGRTARCGGGTGPAGIEPQPDRGHPAHVAAGCASLRHTARPRTGDPVAGGALCLGAPAVAPE